MDAGQLFTALLEPAGQADPYPLYAALHGLGEAVAAGPGLIVVAGYDAISGVLRDPAFLVADEAYYDRVAPDWREHASFAVKSMLSLNPPDHPRIRRLMTRAFTPRRIAELTRAVEQMTGRLLDAMADAGSGGAAVEFMGQFAFELPVAVICELIGIPEQDRDAFRPLGRALTATLEPTVTPEELAAADAAAQQLAGYFTGLIAERRRDPRGDLLSVLVAIRDAADGRLTDVELTDNLILLLVAGFETTTSLLGNGVRIGLTQPGAAAAVRSGAVPPAAFTEEVLRFDSPVQATSRRQDTEAKVGGLVTAPNDEIILLLGAGNRDPRKFADPDAFDPGRPQLAALSFGGGAHFCLGAALARLEGTVAFPRLFRRFPGLAFAGEPERRAGLVLRGFERLPVSLR
jgi:cytochrome P450